MQALAARGVDALYSHQADAWMAAQRGEHLIITTGTASGKTLAFNLPVLDALAREPKHRALYLYPTKALAQDQLRGARRARRPAAPARDLRRRHARRAALAVRKSANVILTNPDMLHIGVLPHHDRWGDVLSNLRYVVVDEAHVYRGVFGSHVANVLRRLRRLAQRLRRRAADPAGVGDDREPGRARALARRRRRDRDRRRRRAARRSARSRSGTRR